MADASEDHPVPPPVAGSAVASWRDAGTIWLWQTRGWAHGIRRTSARGDVAGAARNTFFLVFGGLFGVILVPVVALRLCSPRRRAYLDAERTAVLTVSSHRGRWVVEDHLAAHPGTGAGARLRSLLLPALLADADRRGIPIELEASVPQLAEAYAEELTGLEPVGASGLGRTRYRREPRS